jgi:hypothetical protein
MHGAKREAMISEHERLTACLKEASQRRGKNKPMSEGHKARVRESLAEARRRWEQMRFRRPPKGTPEYRHYCKVRDTLGTEKAREILCASE